MKDTYIYFFEDKLYINLTNRCCNDCTFCIRNNMDGIDNNNLWLSREGTVKEIEDLIDAQTRDYSQAVFCGYGESMYRLDDMLEIARHLHSLGKKTRLDTNGLGDLINGFETAPLLKGNIDCVSVSLNQANAEKYDEVSRSIYGKAAYKAMLDFAAACVRQGLDVIMTVVDVIPQEDIEACRKICEGLGARFRVRSYIK